LAQILIRRNPQLSGLALITGIMPIGASVALFESIGDLFKIPRVKGDALVPLSAQLTASAVGVVLTTGSIAVGILIGVVIVLPFRTRSVSTS
jgi:hypothetical protein